MGSGVSARPVSDKPAYPGDRKRSSTMQEMGSVAGSHPASTNSHTNGGPASHVPQPPPRRFSVPVGGVQHPPPQPPAQRKDEVFKVKDYQHVDEHVRKVPLRFLYGTFRELVAYLFSDPKWNDLAKVRAIFRWMTSVDVFGLSGEEEAPSQSPLDYFLKIKANVGNHAHLVRALCQMVNVPCEIITGMNKSAAYEVGRPVNRRTMGAQWNAVHVAGGWRVIDTFWASACVVGRKTGEWALVDAELNVPDDADEVAEGTTQHHVNEFYFLPDPDQLIWTHLPDTPEWQLLHTPVTAAEFQDHFYVRERFHILHMSMTSRSKVTCVLTTKDGEVDVEFSLPPGTSSHLRYKHMLYRSLTQSEQSAVLDRFVLLEHTEDLLRFSLRFPVRGTFKLDVYGLDIKESDVFDLCCSYIIECGQPKPHCMPLPDCPAVGWGPGHKTKEAGLNPVTHKEAKVSASEGYAEIRLDKEKALALHQQLKHAVLDDATLSKYCLTRVEDDHVIVYLRLPQKGEYALKLFAQEPGAEGEADNVLNYLVQCQGHSDRPFPNTSHGILGRGPAAPRFDVTPVSHSGATIHTQHGKVTVELTASKEAELVFEVHTVDDEAAKRVAVTRRQDDHGGWLFDLDLPESGEYSLSVMARDDRNDAELYSVHTYLVQSDGRHTDDQSEESDDMCDRSREDDSRDTVIHIETVETSDREVLIPLPPDMHVTLAEFHRLNGQNSASAEPVTLLPMEGMNMFRLVLDDYGQYMLNVYTPPSQPGGRVRNVAKYQVNRRRPGELYSDNINAIMDNLQDEEAEPPSQAGSDVVTGNDESIDEDIENAASPELKNVDEDIENAASPELERRRQQTLRALRRAMELRDAKQVEAAISDYCDTGVDSADAVVVRAQKLLTALRAKADLMEASQKRDLATLEKALQQAKEVNFEHVLDVQVAMATQLREHLARLEKLRHAVLNLDQKTVAELKTYGSPPAGVHESMMATFLLLGSPLKDVKQWRTCQALMSKTGRESMMRKISQFDPPKVPLNVAQLARKVMLPYTTDQIRDASAGAATFYIWAQGMVDEVESYGGAEQADQLRLQK